MPARQHRTPGRWAAAGVPLLITGLVTAAMMVTPASPQVAAGSVAGPQPAAAAAGLAAAGVVAPTTVKKGKATVTVDPAAEIPDEAGSVKVSGAGFDKKDDLWVAICQVGGGAPNDLSSCLGGPIPDENATTSWGIVTDQKESAPPGPVVVAWSGDGFTMTLQVAGAADAGADCVTGKCAVYVRGAGDSRSQDVVVPVAFKAPPVTASSSSAATTTSSSMSSASSSTESSTSSSSSAPVATTVPAQSVLLKEVQPGREQVAVFTGFKPGEQVSVSLSGGQAKLPDVKADQVGTVRISWTVPANFPVGGYTLRVEGKDSLRVGEAGFTVIAAPVTSTASAASSTVSSPPSSSTAPSTSSPASSSSVASSTVSSTAESSSAESSAAPTTESSAAVTPTPAAGSNTPWWLWITLAAVLLIGLVVAAVAMGRRHRAETDAERARREAELADAASAEAQRHPQPRPGPVPPVPPGFDEHPDRPILFSHRQAENYSPPTEVIGDPNAPTEMIDPAGRAQQPGRHSAPEAPGTQQFNPFADDDVPPAGPGTQQFDPFADDRETGAGGGQPGPDDPDAGPDDRPDGGDDSTQWRPPRR